jgi:parallel beta-helix repeat protein
MAQSLIGKFKVGKQAIFFAMGIAVVGVIVLQFTRAAVPSSHIEAEVGTLSGGATAFTDGTASDGRAVNFGAIPVACAGISVQPTDSIQAKVDANPAGSTFCLQPGTYREQGVQPKDNMTFIGVGEVILNGSRVLTGFTQEGSLWYVGGQTQEGYVHEHPTQCMPEAPRCMRPEDIFINNQVMKHVASKAAVGAGSWFFDYAADRIYIGDNPSGKTIETSTVRNAFAGYVNNVTIKNMTVEKYASPTQSGAIQAGFGPGAQEIWIVGWKIDAVTARLNHSTGVAYSFSDGFELKNSKMLYNGQQGILGGTGKNILIENNEIAYNNNIRYDFLWEGGGTKFTFSDGIIIRGNNSHDNYGPGLWTDINNYNVLYENNTVTNNLNAGIFHEISYNAIIRNNTVEGNGIGDTQGWCYGAGIQVSASQDVEVYGNTLRNNNDSIIGIVQNRGGDYTVRNLSVHDNTVINNTVSGSRTGICSDIGTHPFTAAYNNRYAANTYQGSGHNWTWNNQELGNNFTNWKATGNDTAGTYTP